MKNATPLLLLLLFACSEDQITDKKVPLTPYEQSDKELRHLLYSYTETLDEYGGIIGRDTSNLVLKYKSAPFEGVNLTEIEKRDTITYITYHKEFLQIFDARGYNFRYMYLAKVLLNRDWECIGPFRELKTQQDIDGFNIMVDNTHASWGCGQPNYTTCCPVVMTIDNNTSEWCWDQDTRAYWFKDVQDRRSYKHYLDTNWDFSNLEALYSQAGIPTCNK